MAQADKPIPRPEVKVDDRWVYRHTDKRMKPPSFVYELRVSFVDSRAIHAVIERQGSRADVEVPAGKFRALKLQADGWFRRIDRVASDEARNTFWYVPQVKRWVKSVYQDARIEVVEELYFYRVQ